MNLNCSYNISKTALLCFSFLLISISLYTFVVTYNFYKNSKEGISSNSSTMSTLKRLHTVVFQPIKAHTGTVIFLHGAGDTGNGISSAMKYILEGGDFKFDNLKVLFPTAPLRSYTPMSGAMVNVWFDWPKIHPASPEFLDTIDSACESLDQLVQEEVQNGIPRNNIVIGGFSQGGSVSLHYAYRYQLNPVKGIFGLSTYLVNDSAVYKKLESLPSTDNLPPLLMYHGQQDTLITFPWGEKTFQKLKSFGIKGEFHPVNDLGHSLNKDEMTHVMKWIQDLFS